MITADYRKRTFNHIKNSMLIMIPIYSIILLFWFIFLNNEVKFKEINVFAGLCSAWIFVFINYKYQLPHYNISDESTDNHKKWVYRFDLYIISIVCIVALFNWLS